MPTQYNFEPAFGVSQRFEQGFIDLANALDHGSGVDCDWGSVVTRTSLRLKNAYHCMDENGCYDGYANFTVIIPIVHKTLIWDHFKVKFNGKESQRRNKEYILSEYIGDIMYQSLSEYFNAN